MTNYRYCLGQEAAEAFGNCDAEQQSDLLIAFRALAQQPFTEGLLQTTDADGRTHYMIAEAGMLIYFWSEHAVREVRISALRKV